MTGKKEFKSSDVKLEQSQQWDLTHTAIEDLYNQLMAGNLAAEYEFQQRLHRLPRDGEDFQFLEEQAAVLKLKPPKELSGPEAYFLGFFIQYTTGQNVQATPFYQIAAQKQHFAAMLQLALANPDHAENRKMLLNAAIRGNPVAQYELGVGAANLQWQHPDAKEAEAYLLSSAQLGFPPANLTLAKRYMSSASPENLLKALQYYRAAAAGGSLEALVELGTMYNEGEIVEKNNKQAVELLQRALDLYDLNTASTTDDEAFYLRTAALTLAVIFTHPAARNFEKAAMCFRIDLQITTPAERVDHCKEQLDLIGADLAELKSVAPCFIYHLGVVTAEPKELNHAFIRLAKESSEIFNQYLFQDIERDSKFLDKLVEEYICRRKRRFS